MTDSEDDMVFEKEGETDPSVPDYEELDRPDPDAWRWQQYIHSNTNSTTRLSVRQPEEIAEEDFDTPERINLVPESKEPLWSASTIQAEIERRIEEYKTYKDKTGELFGDSPRSYQKKIDALEELKEVFQDR